MLPVNLSQSVFPIMQHFCILLIPRVQDTWVVFPALTKYRKSLLLHTFIIEGTTVKLNMKMNIGEVPDVTSYTRKLHNLDVLR